jgi:AAA15 family ATPase/GTPase
MLIDFHVGNFRVFQNPITLSMEAAPIGSRDPRLNEHNLFAVNKKLRLLKSAAIYGANASGKSNLGTAFQFVKQFVLGSSKESQSGERINVEPFRLSDATYDKPSFFEMTFIAEGTHYRYGFEVDQHKVHAEWLFHIPRSRESCLFERQGQKIILSGVFKEGKGLEEKTRPNALFLSVAAQFNGTIAQRILAWFRNLNIISGLEDTFFMGYTLHCLKNNENREAILHLIKTLDIGISDIEVETTQISLDTLPADLPESLKKELLKNESLKEIEAMQVATLHQRYSSEGFPTIQERFTLAEHESEGTQKLVAFAGPLMDTLKHGRVLLVDEFDARFHPLITRHLIMLFHSPSMNPHNAQLIFMTHDTNLLDRNLFRRDQVWFTEKNRHGAATLYSLAEFKVRNDASFEKDYIRGKYGAIPFIGDIEQLPGVADGG